MGMEYFINDDELWFVAYVTRGGHPVASPCCGPKRAMAYALHLSISGLALSKPHIYKGIRSTVK